MSSEPVNIPPSSLIRNTPKSSSISHSPTTTANTAASLVDTPHLLKGSSSSTSSSHHPQLLHQHSVGGIPLGTSNQSITSAGGSNSNNAAGGGGSTSTSVPCPSGSSSTSTSSSGNKMSGLVTSSSSDFSHLLAELKRKPSLHVALPKFGSSSHHNGSCDSLNKSPHSPGVAVGNGDSSGTGGEQLGVRGACGSGDDFNKGLPYKVQKKNYQKEKQRVVQEMSTALRDPSFVIMSDTLKVRGKLKSWTRLWAVLKPGVLSLYKGKVKSSHWVATVLLGCCKVIERPSKKDGFCFKLFHPLEQSIWSNRGPDGESIGAVCQPLPATYLICRVPTADEGKCWMDGLELALTCSSLLVRSPRTGDSLMDTTQEASVEWGISDAEENNRSRTNSEKSDSEESQIEINEHEHDSEDDDVYENNNDVGTSQMSTGEERSVIVEDPISSLGLRKRRKRSEMKPQESMDDGEESTPAETCYALKPEEEFAHTTGEHSEVLGDENKSLLWFLLKQVRPGMDLSRVVLPTFILEPRSFLDKLTDYYYHADLLSQAVKQDDPRLRMVSVLRWYLSGFYKKPKGLKKPYNPILGETFRCYWEHSSGSRTYYVAEQVSHHPPVSAFYVSNKRDGFVISSAILAKSKFYGNSTSAILDGQATLTLLPRGEAYVMTMPYAHCKGILLGTLSMELGGNVTIVCEKTGYFCELEFKLKGFLGRSDTINGIYGKLKLGKETLATIEGHWDNRIILKDRRQGSEETLWEVNDRIRSRRLKRFTVPIDKQLPTESERKWLKVTEAIGDDNQDNATTEKTKLEDEQRKAVAERIATSSTWIPKHFVFDGTTWRYRHEDLRPWDDGNDLMEFERDYVVQVHQRHKTPIMRTSSLVSVDSKCDIRRDNIHPDQVLPAFHARESNRQLIDLLRQLLARQIQQSEQIEELRSQVASIQAKLARPKTKDPFPVTNTILAVVFGVAMQILMIIYWFGDAKLIPDIGRRKL